MRRVRFLTVGRVYRCQFYNSVENVFYGNTFDAELMEKDYAHKIAGHLKPFRMKRVNDNLETWLSAREIGSQVGRAGHPSRRPFTGGRS